MRCPFLKETTVRRCGEESGHPVFLTAEEESSGSRCLDASYVRCNIVQCHFGREGIVDPPARRQCPLLRERLVQYCDATPVRTYVPYIHGLLSRCQNDSFRYCPLYLQRERPEVRLGERSHRVRELIVPTDRSYSHNHFWIEEGDLGLCHIGVDAFVTRLLDRVDVVHYVSRRGLTRPHVVLGSERVQFDLLFPELLEITETNAHLRSHPESILEDPYGAGWLFEGQLAEASRHSPAERGLIAGECAEAWMEEELQRLDSFVHDELIPAHAGEGVTCADGGEVQAGLTRSLAPVEIARLFHEFFRSSREV